MIIFESVFEESKMNSSIFTPHIFVASGNKNRDLGNFLFGMLLYIPNLFTIDLSTNSEERSTKYLLHKSLE